MPEHVSADVAQVRAILARIGVRSVVLPTGKKPADMSVGELRALLIAEGADWLALGGLVTKRGLLERLRTLRRNRRSQ